MNRKNFQAKAQQLINTEIFSLLHLAENEFSAVNVNVKNFTNQIEVYLANASLLNKSLKAQGLSFTLLTNNKSRLESVARRLQINLKIEEVNFPTEIPSGINFYSAHFKIDAFRYLSKLKTKYLIFCDLDVVCINPLPEVLTTLQNIGIPIIYDITDQIIPSEGHYAIMSNIETLIGIPSEGRWVGGEFIAGPPEFFAKLTKYIDEILPNYFNNLNYGTISTNGNDEVYTTAAIEKMKRESFYVSDGGLMYLIGRFWSSGTKFAQKPFRYFESVSFLHLPADKYFLQKMNTEMVNFDSKLFLKKYRNMLLLNKLKGIHRSIIYLLFRIKAKTVGLRSISWTKK